MIRSRKHTTAKSSSDDEGAASAINSTPAKGKANFLSSSWNEVIGATQGEFQFANRQVDKKVLMALISMILLFGFWLEAYHNSAVASGGTKGSAGLDFNTVNPGRSLLSADEDALLVTDPKDDQVYHVIFSTDCGSYQAWQSYLTFFRAMKVKQPGHVTRIASGCTEEEKEAIESWFTNHIQPMSTRFHLLLTPHFSQVKDEQGNVIGDYPFFNKPFGLKFFLENFELLDFDGNGNFPTTEDAIIILMDPDMSMLRPITKDFTSDEDVVISKNRKEHILGRTVQHGIPFAQTYGFGSQFLKLDMEKIGGPDSRLLTTTHEEGRLYYPIGPPYIATVRDMYQLSLKWTEFVPKVHAQYPHLLAEMFAMSLAAAHLDLKHQLLQSLMISDTHTGDGEGWALIDAMPAEHVCEYAREADYKKHPLPSVVHLCQRYSLGKEWFFGKRKIPHDVYECPKPLFEEPPDNVATLFDYKWPPNAKEKTALTPQMAKREAFMICHLTKTINEAAAYYKESACDSSTANLKKNMKVADLFRGGK